MFMEDEPILVWSIGYVENDFDIPTDPETLREAESSLVLDPELSDGLLGLELGQTLLVMFYFDRSQGFDLLHHPRGDRNKSKRGVFTLRSPNRPNPIIPTLGFDFPAHSINVEECQKSSLIS